MTRADVITSLASQGRYLPLTITGTLDGCRLSFSAGETLADFKTSEAAFNAMREAEKATAALLARVFH